MSELQSKRIPTRDSKLKAIDHDLEKLKELIASASPELTDFLYVAGIDEPNPILMPRISTLNGKSTWGAIGDVSLLIYWDGVDSWVISEDGVDIYSIVDAVESEHPSLVGDWDIIGQSPDIITLATLYVNSDLQTALEDIAQATTYALGAYVSDNVSYNNTTSGLTAVNVQAAIDEVVTMIPQTTTTVVNISSAQILAMGSSPIELLPAPGVGKYYDIEKIILEFTPGISAYTFSSDAKVFPLDYIIAASSFTGLDDTVTIVKDNQQNDSGINKTYRVEVLNSSITLGLSGLMAADPTLGDGTLRAIITYTIRTFGA